MNLKDIQARNSVIKKDHESLEKEIAEWREWWGELSELGSPHFGEMGDRVARFREHLAAHFEREEDEGFLSLVIDADRDAAPQIAKLRDEHAELLAALDDLIARLRRGDPVLDCWGRAREEFEDFIDRLNCHEEAEDALLEKLR